MAFYVYGFADSASPRELRYVGGAYSRRKRKIPREWVHSATSGAKSTRVWFAEVEAEGRKVIRRKLLICSERAMYEEKMEQRVWDAYKAAGHRLLNDRPMAWPRTASGKGAAARDARRKVDPEYDTWIRAKIGNTKKGKKHSSETRAKISAGNKGKKRSLEIRAAISARQTGKPRSPETRAKISASNKGKKPSPEHLLAMTGWKHSPETRAKMRVSHTGKQHSPETRAKMRTSREKKLRPRGVEGDTPHS